jgi:signal transduction histidine kinase/CheY-like chemotaxis protein
MVITASSVVISISSAQNQILRTLETDMRLVATLANEYVSGEIDQLKASAAAVAQRLKDTSPDERQQVLIEQVAAYEYFQAVAIFTPDGKMEASYGNATATGEMILGEHGQKALAGQRTISTSCYDPSGHLVFFVFVPLDDYQYQMAGEQNIPTKIVVCTIPGMFFSELVNRFLVWDTGNITMQDRDGTIIANIYSEWVTERLNFLELAQNDRSYEGVARAVRQMTAGESGTDRFAFEDTDAVLAYRPITASDQGWSLAVIAPVAESPFYQVRVLILIAGLIFLGLGLIAAAFSSGVIARPFYRLREQNTRLIELNEAAQAASRTKSSFLANMSHEMRTPLSAIIGFSELTLKDTNLAPGTGNSLKKIYESGVVLLGVVNNLLDISTMESKKFEITPVEYDFARFINETATINKIRIGSKPITFTVTLGENLPAHLIGDELRVRQIFNNLLSNAFAFTHVGTVEWKITAERDRDSVWIISSVADTGAGIKPEDIAKIFMDYRKLDIWEEHFLEGTGLGLGLSLSRKITEFMDGKLTVESDSGKGSVFSVRIRQKASGDDVMSAETVEGLQKFTYTELKRISNAELDYIQLPEKRVLVADDNALNLEVARRMLEPYGLQIDYVDNGTSVIELIRKGQPRYDAIFLDHVMPGVDGMETTRIIRESIDSEYAKNIPIIVVTANIVTGYNEVFMACGFQDFLGKPIDAVSLDRVIHKWVAR